MDGAKARMDRMDKLLLAIWLPQIKHQLAPHPDRDEIVERLKREEFTTEDVDKWFAEAEHYSAEYMQTFQHVLAKHAAPGQVFFQPKDD